MLRTGTRIAGLAAAALIALPAAALATPTLVSPKDGSSTTVSRPTFNWTVGVGETTSQFVLTQKKTVNNGVLGGDTIETKNDPGLSYKLKDGLMAGRYYWQITSSVLTMQGEEQGFSPVASFTVKPNIQLGRLSARPHPNEFDAHTESLKLTMACNFEGKVFGRVQVYKGTKQIHDEQHGPFFCNAGKPELQDLSYPGGEAAPGSTLKAKVTFSKGKRLTDSATVTFKAK